MTPNDILDGCLEFWSLERSKQGRISGTIVSGEVIIGFPWIDQVKAEWVANMYVLNNGEAKVVNLVFDGRGMHQEIIFENYGFKESDIQTVYQVGIKHK